MNRKPNLLKTRLTAYIPILTPHRDDFQAHEFWNLLEDLPQLSGKIDPSYNEDSKWSPIRLSVFDGENDQFAANADDRAFIRLWRNAERSRAVYVLKVAGSVSFSRSSALNATKKWRQKIEVRISGYKLMFRLRFEDVINDLLLVVNLARPGLFDLGEGFILQDGKLVKRTDVAISDLRWAMGNASKMKWPQFHSLELSRVCEWALKNELLGGLGKTPLGRAFNAFSYLFTEPLDERSVLLFWSLIGIEALYVRSSANIMEQVRERTQLLLGPMIDYKKTLGRMYELRSKFIHGALPFPGQFFSSDALPEYEQFSDQLIEASLLGQAILTATLQEMVVRDWGKLSFSTVLNEMT